MKQIYKTINYEWLTKPTGDPFADAGGYALKEFIKRYQDLDMLEIIMKATDIYVDRWSAKINPFFLNSKITQSAFNFDQKKNETKKYFLSLINGTAKHEEGICRISGQKTDLFPAGRDNSVLSGSGKFVNFHHSFQEGIMLSKEVMVRFHFLPLACEYLLGRISVINSNIEQISEFFSADCCRRNLSALASNISEGILKSSSHSLGTALYRYVDKVLNESKLINDDEDCSISLYHFTNFGASPEIQIYTLPSESFKFYIFTQKAQFRQQWDSFVNSYYVADKEHKKAKYDDQKDTYICDVNNSPIIIQQSDFKYWKNVIYDKILNGQSISGNLLDWSRKYEISFDIIKEYEINIIKMKKETILKVKQMADFILTSNDERGIEKAIKKLDGVKNPYLLRRFVLKDVVSKYYNEGNQEAIITVEDYANYLFPDTESWKEMRDVLLIAIYQKLHEKNMYVKVGLSDSEEDIENV